MKIGTYLEGKKQEIEFVDYFKSTDTFKLFIKEKNEFINVDNLYGKISDVYNQLAVLDLKIKSSLLSGCIIQQFGFKYKRPIKLEFWEERGFGLKEFNEYVSKTKIGNNQFTINKNKGSINDFDQENCFEYGEFNFKSTGKPKCNFCHQDLSLSPSVGKYIITGCENINCASQKNTNIWFIRQLAFLPKETFENKNKRLDLESKVYPYYWLLNGFDYDNSLKKIENIKKELLNIPINSVQYYKILFGISEAEARIKVKQNSPISKDYLGYKNLSEDEIKNKISLLQKENANKFVIKKENNPELYSAYTPSQVYYWINKGLSIEEAKVKQSERQSTFSLEKCIEKLGEEKGRDRWVQRQEKWLKNYKRTNYSKISQTLFWEIHDKLDKNYKQSKNIYFATLNQDTKIKDVEDRNNEFRLKLNKSFILPDFFILEDKKIIEFDGVYYHRNSPENKTRELERDQNIKDSGYKILHISEEDFNIDKLGTIKKCLEFLQLNKID